MCNHAEDVMNCVNHRYTHRVGRTGRAGHSGTALTLFVPEDKKMQTELEANLAGKPLSTAISFYFRLLGLQKASSPGRP